MSRVWSRAPRALWRRSGDRVVVLGPRGGQPLVLTGTGRVSWELLDEPLSEEELITALAQLYGAEEGIVRRELEPFLEALVTVGVVTST
jgi:hypothetical protein